MKKVKKNDVAYVYRGGKISELKVKIKAFTVLFGVEPVLYAKGLFDLDDNGRVVHYIVPVLIKHIGIKYITTHNDKVIPNADYVTQVVLFCFK
jgi:hypothetical protein